MVISVASGESTSGAAPADEDDEELDEPELLELDELDDPEPEDAVVVDDELPPLVCDAVSQAATKKAIAASAMRRCNMVSCSL